MKIKKVLSVWDCLAWAALAGIFLWLVLKALGVINTPLLLEYSPFFGAVYIAGWAMHKLDRATDDIKENTKDIRESTQTIIENTGNIKDVKTELKSVERRITHVEANLGAIRENCPALLGK